MQQKIQQALADSPLSNAILSALEEQEWKGFLPAEKVRSICDEFKLTPVQLGLVLLPVAACYSHTPISEFHVGAIAIGESGDFYFGANQEFKGGSMAQTIHAEQSAISHAWLRNEPRITDIVVNYTPCGHCRQFMNELYQAEDLKIHLPHSQNNPLPQYLPDSFGPKDLGVDLLLLNKEEQGFTLTTEDEVANKAILGANRAHSPYSKSPHGVGILFKNGEMICGRYAENAAFNPSLPAMQTAINFAYLNQLDVSKIERVVFAEKPLHLSYRKMAEQLLKSLCKMKMEYISL